MSKSKKLIEKEDLRRWQSWASSCHKLAEALKMTSLTNGKMNKVEHIADMADQIQHQIEEALSN